MLASNFITCKYASGKQNSILNNADVLHIVSYVLNYTYEGMAVKGLK